jgi:hypothetical protein
MSLPKKLKPSLPRKRGKPANELPADAHTWPILHAYAPWRDCWNATGCGAVIIIRHAPDGRYGVAAGNIILMSGGVSIVFGRTFDSLAEVDEFLADMDRILAPWGEADPEVVGEYAWGARALTKSYGSEFDGRAEALFQMFPPVRGTSAQRIARLLGDGGLTPPALAAIVKRNCRPDAPDDGREPMVITTLAFRIGDYRSTLRAMRAAEPDFSEVEEHEFVWTREYPKGHWSPFAGSGQRQILGSACLEEGGILKAEAKTLSMSAVLVSKVRKLARGDLRIEKVEWSDLTATKQRASARREGKR